jgi:lipoprotein-anchoring transpeptidase ErfK/SrfK
MTRVLLASAGLMAAFAVSPAIAASDIPRPPAVLSPDLTDPWLLQLQPGKARPALSFPRATRSAVFAPPATPQKTTGPAMTPASAVVTIQDPAATERVADYPIDAAFMPAVVPYPSTEKAGTIIVDTPSRHLYLIMGGGKALRYGVGVGRPGFEWAGVHHVTRMAEWPDWTPPDEMLKRKPDLPRHMDGGPNNPLGARALYLGSSLYRIHGSNEPWTIGHAVSSGCIRMRNQDVIDLFQRVSVGAKVIVI